MLRRLSDWHLIQRLPRTVGGASGGSDSYPWAIGPAGHRLLAIDGRAPRRFTVPGARHAAHTLAITEFAIRLHERHVARELDLVRLEPEPACWRPYLGPMGSKLMLKPDLRVVVAVGSLEDHWAVEVDLQTESLATVVAKCKRYVAFWRGGSEPVVPRVLWTVPSARRGEQIVEALATLPSDAWPLFAVKHYDEASAFIAAEAQS